VLGWCDRFRHPGDTSCTTVCCNMDIGGQAVDLFDAASAQTIFWETVPVLLQRNDRDDSFEALSVRLLSGHTRHNHALKVLRMHLFNDSDLFFLHTLEVSEEDFQTLKVEQGILVDFANFSGKIIDLLKRCIQSRGEDTPRFRAVLVMSGGESIFKMVETNDFKQLAHINLCFRPGTDLAVKSFLAFRLTEMQCNCERLQAEVQGCRQDLSAQKHALAEQLAAFKEMETRHNRMLMENDAATKDAAACARQEHVREREEMVAVFERWALPTVRCVVNLRRMAVLQSCVLPSASFQITTLLHLLQQVTCVCRTKIATHEQHVKEMSALQDRTNKLDTENRDLREQKYGLEAQVAELRLKLTSAEQRGANLHEEVNHLQKQSQSLNRCL
jgi:spindle assembly abnormal protein 6